MAPKRGTQVVAVVSWLGFAAVAAVAGGAGEAGEAGGALEPVVWSVPNDGAGATRWIARRGGKPWSAATVDVAGGMEIAPGTAGGGLIRTGIDGSLSIVRGGAAAPAALEPGDAFTAAAWVSLDSMTQWGGIIGRVQDDGGAERGWLLGYGRTGFAMAVSTEGADDGDGDLTYLYAAEAAELGRWYHVAATYDGAQMRLFVDGAVVATSDAQSGPVLSAADSPLVIGGYRDSNEDFPMHGRLGEVRFVAEALDDASVAELSQARPDLRATAPWRDRRAIWVVAPYLTWPRTDGVTVLAETRLPSRLRVRVWPDGDVGATRTFESEGPPSTVTQVRVRGLESDRKHFYEVEAVVEVAAGDMGAADEADEVGATDASDAAGATDVSDAARTTDVSGASDAEGVGRANAVPRLLHDRRAFRTAASRGRPFTVAIFGDTQTNATVARRVASEAFANRPNFFIVAGDLVDDGASTEDWQREFFPAMRPLIEYAPMASVLGNHERDAEQYYEYIDLPGNERWYTLSYGDADFFMLDANRPLEPGSPQYVWLDAALERSDALWKFAVMHQPPYTSDSDDYGDTTRGESRRGDPNARHPVALFERHGVDICFSGHVHDYERTLPIRDGLPARWDQGGVIYVTTAGGGGPLEDFDHVNTDFGHRKARRHHGCHVLVHGRKLEFQAIDEHGELFDVMMLEKPADGSR